MSNDRLRFHRIKRSTALGLLAVYLCGVLLGCFVIWAIPFASNRADMLEIAANKGDEVLSAGLMDEVTIFGMEHWLYSERGQVVSHEAEFLHASQREYIRSFVPEVLEKGHLFIPAFFRLSGQEKTSGRVFGIIAGVVVEGPTGNRFVSILLRDFPDMGTIMIIYIALFSIMYLVGVIFVCTLVRKERELNRMRRDLIANVSHELKTPITAIRAMAEVLHDGMAKDIQSQRTYSGKIIEESDLLEQLVLDILELSRLQSRQAEFQKILVHADGILPPVIDRYMMLCGDLGITLDTTGLSLESIPTLYTDAERLITLVNVLMDNAVKFTGKGGSIWITQQLSPKSVTFCIRDNGPGIQSKDVDRIFDRFYKADLAHNSAGSGLGLAIADEIAKGLGEKLWVESTYGAGASFYFTVGLKPGGSITA